MIENLARRLGEPRSGVVTVTAVVWLLMAAHWPPMSPLGCILLGVAVFRPSLAVRSHVWWAAAGLWVLAGVFMHDHMEDHVYLFTAWLVALALSLSADDDDAFLARAAWHARMLVGATFATAVAWKLYFSDYVLGTTLWLFMLIDHRFEPLADAVGLSATSVADDRAGLTELLDGTSGSLVLDAPTSVVVRIVAAAMLTLLIECVIVVAHLAPDTSRIAALRLPSVVLFGLVTYAVVPVIPFAALLGLLAMVVGRWMRGLLWVLPVMVSVSLLRLLLLS